MVDNQPNIAITLHRRRQLEPKQQLHKYTDLFCFGCGTNDNENQLLLCDMCDGGYHFSCVRPVLHGIPDGPWFCPSCSHLSRPLNRTEKLKKCRDRLNKYRAVLHTVQDNKMKKPKRKHDE